MNPPGSSHLSTAPGLVDADVTDRLAAAKLWLISTTSPTSCGNLPYLATAVYALIPVGTPRVRAMAIDRHWRLYVNPFWILATDVPAIAGRLAHLTWHLLSQHAERAADLEVRRSTTDYWTRAADASIAELIPALDPDLLPPAAWKLPAGRSTEEYYARLSGLPAGSPPEPAREPASSSGEGPVDDTCGSACDGHPRAHELPPASDAGVGSVDSVDADEIRRRVAIEFREHQDRCGTLPGEWSRWVAGILDPVIPWTQVLAAAVRRGVGWTHGHTDYTYSRISRRQASAGRIILPATRHPVPEVAVVVDTSGSIDDGLLSQALGEVDGVLAGLGISGRSVTVLATDAAVHAVSRIHSARDAQIIGGGGTDMRVGIAAALEQMPRPTLIVVLTDGYTPWPESPTVIPIIATIIGRRQSELPATPAWVQRVECVRT